MFTVTAPPNALCGPQVVPACVSLGLGRAANPGPRSQPSCRRQPRSPEKELPTQVVSPPTNFSKQGAEHFLKNPAVPRKSAEWPFCVAPDVPGALPGFLMRHKRRVLWAAAWASGLRTGRGASKDAAPVPRDRLTPGVTLGWLLNLFTP